MREKRTIAVLGIMGQMPFAGIAWQMYYVEAAELQPIGRPF